MQANKISEAIKFYTKAINMDGANHVYFSSRSAAADANSCLGLKPDFSNPGKGPQKTIQRLTKKLGLGQLWNEYRCDQKGHSILVPTTFFLKFSSYLGHNRSSNFPNK